MSLRNHEAPLNTDHGTLNVAPPLRNRFALAM
jgi:hypothetical protein